MLQRSLIAILVSLTGISLILKINRDIADLYMMSGEKTKAVFSLVELGFVYKYFIAVFGFIAIVLSVRALQKGEKKQFVWVAMILSIAAFLATFIKLWRFMV